MKRTGLALALAAVAGSALAAGEDNQALLAELKRLAARVEALEQQNTAMRQSLASKQAVEGEPEIVARLKAVESKSASGLPAALEGVSVEASITSVVQKTSRSSTASAAPETRGNYRGDVTVSLPGGRIGEAEGSIFAHLRFGQGNGIGLRPTYSSGPNTSAFQVGSVAADDSFAILAQAWYQLALPIKRGG